MARQQPQQFDFVMIEPSLQRTVSLSRNPNRARNSVPLLSYPDLRNANVMIPSAAQATPAQQNLLQQRNFAAFNYNFAVEHEVLSKLAIRESEKEAEQRAAKQMAQMEQERAEIELTLERQAQEEALRQIQEANEKKQQQEQFIPRGIVVNGYEQKRNPHNLSDGDATALSLFKSTVGCPESDEQCIEYLRLFAWDVEAAINYMFTSSHTVTSAILAKKGAPVTLELRYPDGFVEQKAFPLSTTMWDVQMHMTARANAWNSKEFTLVKNNPRYIYVPDDLAKTLVQLGIANMTCIQGVLNTAL